MGDTGDGDDALVRCARAGDRAALAALFERHHARVFRAAYLVARSPEAADDIVQLVFLELFRALDTFDPRRPFVPWLYRIVHNVGIDYMKRERYRRPTAPLADATPGPTGEIGRAEARSDVRPALDRLSAEHREALVLRYYVGLPEREMAAVLGVRPGTVKSRLHRALHALGAALGPGDDGPGGAPTGPTAGDGEGSHG
jgi:RNA polymerase sigma-70 factor (ECF subfamily)